MYSQGIPQYDVVKNCQAEKITDFHFHYEYWLKLPIKIFCETSIYLLIILSNC